LFAEAASRQVRSQLFEVDLLAQYVRSSCELKQSIPIHRMQGAGIRKTGEVLPQRGEFLGERHLSTPKCLSVDAR